MVMKIHFNGLDTVRMKFKIMNDDDTIVTYSDTSKATHDYTVIIGPETGTNGIKKVWTAPILVLEYTRNSKNKRDCEMAEILVSLQSYSLFISNNKNRPAGATKKFYDITLHNER